MKKIIAIKHLTKEFGNKKVIDDLNFNISEGEFTAFLGENGAGKSTTISILTTLLKPTYGQVSINGFQLGRDDAKIRKQIGVVFQSSILDSLLTPKEILISRGKLYNLTNEEILNRLTELKNLLNMNSFFNRHYGLLSGGQRRKVDIARALIHKPAILFLDEPTTGLDPTSRKLVWNAITELRKSQHLTIFLTTHYLEEVESANKVIIIHHGKLKAIGTPTELKKKFAKNTLDVWINGIKETRHFSNSKDVIKYLNENLNRIDDFEYRHGSMNEVFFNVTKETD